MQAARGGRDAMRKSPRPPPLGVRPGVRVPAPTSPLSKRFLPPRREWKTPGMPSESRQAFAPAVPSARPHPPLLLLPPSSGSTRGAASAARGGPVGRAWGGFLEGGDWGGGGGVTLGENIWGFLAPR